MGDRRRTGEWSILAVVALGGALGALARYAAGLVWPTSPASFPLTTFAINVVGCALMGALMVLVLEVTGGRAPDRPSRAALGRIAQWPLLRPFLGTGVLGGFTTFSTYAVDIRRLLADGRLLLALGYLGATVACCLAAVVLSTALARRLLGGPPAPAGASAPGGVGGPADLGGVER